MTRTTKARIAGFTYLFYIAAGISSLVLFGKAASGDGTAAKLASIAQHATAVRFVVILDLLTCFTALTLGVALYGITRVEDHELSLLALLCRVCEGLFGAIGLRTTLGLLGLATTGTADAATTNSIGAFLFLPGTQVSATFFAVGSTIFCWLLLRGRMVPVVLAGLGAAASVLLVATLPLELAGFLKGAMTLYLNMWMPILVFEVTVAAALLVNGV